MDFPTQIIIGKRHLAWGGSQQKLYFMQHHVPRVQFYFCYFVPQEKCLDTNLTSSTENVLTEEMDSDHLVCNVQTVINCTQSKSIPATIKMYPPKPRGKGRKANMTALLSRDIVF